MLLLVGFVGCTPVAPGPGPGGGGSSGSTGTATPKTITVGALNALKSFGGWSANSSGGALTVAEVHSDVLVTNDERGALVPRLAAALPSLENGTIIILPDGRMQTTWALRPDVKWHDGVPFTSADVAFTFQAMTDPEIPFSRAAQLQQMERIDTPDPLTAVITWRTVFFQPLRLGLREFWLLPKHLLGEKLADKAAFPNLPYFTTDYVHLGPFRLVDYGIETQIFERFPGYFLGLPRVNTIVLRAIGDPNALFANLAAGAVDIVTENTLPDDLFLRLREEWGQTGGGAVAQRRADWRYLWVQFNPEWGRPPELSRDVRIRRGLYAGFDRDALREVIMAGLADTEADSFMDPADPRAAIVGKPFAQYRYNPASALQDLADAGWNRAADGQMRYASGESVQVELRGNQRDAQDVAIIARHWRDLGIDVKEDIIPAALVADAEHLAKFPGLWVTARGNSDSIAVRFDSRSHATAQNRWTGANQASYVNPAMNQLIDRLYRTIDEQGQGLILKEMGELLAGELSVLPTYFRMRFAAVVKGVRAVTDDYPGAILPGFVARNAYRWDRD